MFLAHVLFIKKKTIAVYLLCFAFLTLVFSSLSIWLGAPLLLGDSYGYIERAILGETSLHWANLYTLMVHVFVVNLDTIKLISIFQNALLSIVLILIYQFFTKSFSIIYVCLLSILLIPTSLIFISNLVMADVFTGMGVLLLFLIFKMKSFNLKNVFILLLFSICFIAHKSHIVIFPILSLSYFIFLVLKNRGFIQIPQFAVVMLTLFCAQFLVKPKFTKILSNQKLEKVKSIKRSTINGNAPAIDDGYYFLLWRFNASGGLEKFLSNNCLQKQYNLCKHKKVWTKANGIIIIPLKHFVSIFERNENNVAYLNEAKEVKSIVLQTLVKPKYWKYYLKSILEGCKKKIVNYNIRTGYSKNFKAMLNKRFGALIKDRNIENEMLEAYHAENLTKLLKLSKVQITFFKFYSILFLISTIGLLFLNYDTKMVDFILFLILAFLINWLICGGFSNPNNSRYISRLTYLLFIPNVILIANYLNLKLSNKA